MRHPDLDLVTQAVLLSAVAILASAILIRIAVFFRGQYARIPHRYPVSWTNDQVKVFERFRVVIGVAVMLTWATLQMLGPRMPESWPFGFEQATVTVGVLLLANAWLLLLPPRNWEHSILDKASFAVTIGVLAWWWTTFLGALLVTIALLTMRPVALPLAIGVYA